MAAKGSGRESLIGNDFVRSFVARKDESYGSIVAEFDPVQLKTITKGLSESEIAVMVDLGILISNSSGFSTSLAVFKKNIESVLRDNGVIAEGVVLSPKEFKTIKSKYYPKARSLAESKDASAIMTGKRHRTDKAVSGGDPTFGYKTGNR